VKRAPVLPLDGECAPSTGSGLQLLDRAFKLVTILNSCERKVSLQELATSLGVSKSSVHRLLTSLSRLEFVTRDATGRYQAGPKMKELSADVWSEADVRTVALPHMERLRELSRETVSLHVRDGLTHVVVEQCESPFEVRWMRRIGRVYPLARGANASVLLAYLPPAEAAAILARTGRPAHPGPSMDDLEAIRRAGYALVARGTPVDGYVIAAPIFARGNVPIGSLCISGPNTRFDAITAQSFARALVQKAQLVSRAMGLRRGADTITA
jgi:DNA-binding IclR family transcriptional regulator